MGILSRQESGEHAQVTHESKQVEEPDTPRGFQVNLKEALVTSLRRFTKDKAAIQDEDIYWSPSLRIDLRELDQGGYV